MGKYDDMIYMDRPVASKPRMATADRAKIFQPFAALKGHNELIKEQHRLTVEKKALTEQRRDELDSMLGLLEQQVKTGECPETVVVHFIKDTRASEECEKFMGKYVETFGKLRKIDRLEEVLLIGEQRILIHDIFDIKMDRDEGDLFTNI